MSIGKAIELAWKEEEIERSEQSSKCGDYSGEKCPNCGRQSIMIGKDKKHRCEKCAWCIDDQGYDLPFSEFLRT